MSLCITKFQHQFHQTRTFIAARIKWVRDPYLDKAVSKEKNLKQIIYLKNQILSSPSKSLPLSSLSPLKQHLNLPITVQKFFEKYPSVFSGFQPSPSLPLHVKLTPQALSIHKEEQVIYSSRAYRDDAIKRLAKILMLSKVKRLPLHVIDMLKFDLGLPHDYITALLSEYPEYFHICEDKDVFSCDRNTFFLELVQWKDEFAVSELEKRAASGDTRNVKRGKRIPFLLSLPNGFDLKKKVQDWVFQWQGLPYISPYENAFHLNRSGDQAEKWTVAVLHELLWLLVSKKTEKQNVLRLGEYLGFGDRFKKALVHHPGIFYVSNKIRTQTVVLREAYRKDFLTVKHSLMGMRFRYIYLMSKDEERPRRFTGDVLHSQMKRQVSLSTYRGLREKINGKSKGVD